MTRTEERRTAPRRRASDVAYAVVGVVGELLITVGVVLGLFVVWQLWWTDVQAGRVQEQIVAQLDWADPPADDAPVAQLRTDAPPALEEPAADGDTIALLYVPRWDGHDPVTVRQGVDRPTILDTGSGGHYPGTAMPGGTGNFAVAGHRTTYGKPFNRVAELETGDALVVRTPEAWFVYRVTSHQIVLPEQVDVIAPVPGEPEAAPERAMITLTACHPMFSARERYIVHGELEGWMPVADGVPAALTEGA
ncbi:sortase A [Flavimobilis soli]|uniref:Sortase A n=1 Tax=Flavimobilis soli TaxID=442709 RepID=A0A2A9EF80_9MICO|nr:class E sortase [Flavimobilis soli]PFG36880.1 sortase A [Flavimobilis soli]